MTKRIVIKQVIGASVESTFDWMAHSNNFSRAPWVFSSKWRDSNNYTVGAVRNIFMLAGWYQEEITEFVPNEIIQYRVLKSFLPVKQDFTEMKFEKVSRGTMVTWTIDIDVLIPIIGPILTQAAGKLAAGLYGSILTAGKKVLERG
ncbi:SRPBCC family protein [Paucilactobacillus nenjiangensis]|uniref:SRPBCC family protein n=1 Tax=Paucilactobacillus nenjiangensis TaxID=1296540 RepID=UPI0010F59E49|nr:SRPBCC family protein [Paucilactobacillus nenjiangensis]